MGLQQATLHKISNMQKQTIKTQATKKLMYQNLLRNNILLPSINLSTAN
jgi:hypothetical protein